MKFIEIQTELLILKWGVGSECVPAQYSNHKKNVNASGMKYAWTYREVTNVKLQSHSELN